MLYYESPSCAVIFYFSQYIKSSNKKSCKVGLMGNSSDVGDNRNKHFNVTRSLVIKEKENCLLFQIVVILKETQLNTGPLIIFWFVSCNSIPHHVLFRTEQIVSQSKGLLLIARRLIYHVPSWASAAWAETGISASQALTLPSNSPPWWTHTHTHTRLNSWHKYNYKYKRQCSHSHVPICQTLSKTSLELHYTSFFKNLSLLLIKWS